MRPDPRSWLAEMGRAALDLAVPQECAGCASPGRAWCPDCAAGCAGPSVAGPGALPCRSATAHEGPAARAVVAFKDAGIRSLAIPLGALLAGAVLDVLGEVVAPGAAPVWLVPVPARAEARRRRGADHMGVLAQRAARELRERGVLARRRSALVHVRGSRDQVGLSGTERRANVRGTLRAHQVPPGLVVVVDDVTTTGATLAEAARALRALTGTEPVAATVTRAGATAHLASRDWRD